MSAANCYRTIPMYQIDAFTRKPFAGNPAAVCLVPPDTKIGDDILQKIAAENNLAETAYLELAQGTSFKESAIFKLRWFTPTTEVPLCGHATLASAAALFFEEGNQSPELEFQTLSGSLFVKRLAHQGGEADISLARLEMKFPSLPATDPVPANLGKGSEVVALVAGDLPVAEVLWRADVRYLLVVLGESVSQEQLEALSPNHSAMKDAKGTAGTISGVMLTCRSKPGSGSAQVLSRFFAPWMGIPEDPVTGSAHSVLAPFWAERLNSNQMTARQCSVRGGDLEMQLVPEDGKVLIRGQAVTVIRGHIRVE